MHKCCFCNRQFSSILELSEHNHNEHLNAMLAEARLHGQVALLRKRLESMRNEKCKQNQQNKHPVKICTLCYENRKTLALAPCSHCICQTCFDKLQGNTRRKRCPYCRKTVLSTIDLQRLSRIES